ncbi:hypothetical protein [Campylobacter concisus]|uniref:hypothetical protein n=1 Tax=Campylobacter concisus TaxID=199 RepID=UPI0018C22296|nr:hypothetical protein [Campylobacter concisus]
MAKCLAYAPLLLLGFLNSTAKSVIKIFNAPLMPKKNLALFAVMFLVVWALVTTMQQV